ncbi:MAG TPA: Smr/MutS family protein, partial [Longimicrobiales bacterium]|nr:Smr/MutS family protein [Longimicrobiales bacterium]
LAARADGVVNGSLHFDTATLSPTYRFQLGVPGRSYGLAIARRLGIDPGVLAEAEAEVPEAERSLESLLASVEERDRDLRARLEQLDAAEADSRALADRLSAREALMKDREETLAQRERTAERRAREAAREHLLGARAEVEAALVQAAQATSEEAQREARRAVEEAIRREGDAIKLLESAAASATVVTAPLVVGRRVRTAAGAVGRIAELRADGKLVVTAGAMRMVVPRDSVEPVAESAPVERHAASPAVEPVAASDDAPMEIDLRGFRVEEAEIATMAAIDAAVIAEHPHLRIIHGMGTGVVRDRVRRVLQQDRRVAKFDFAPRAQGGTGATVVEFK